jgi:FkbM family methyltransferase
MEPLNEKCLRERRALVVNDVFKLRQHMGRKVLNVLDVGANIGLFSQCASILFPEAQIIALEPCKEIFKVLKRNVEFLGTVEPINMGFGVDGHVKPILDDSFPLGSMAKRCSHKEEGALPSMSLPTLVNKYLKKEGEFLFKFDCEGAEASLVGDEESEGILKEALHIGMEVHFYAKPEKTHEWLEWSVYNDWVHDVFEATHDILYHESSKKIGYGHYVLRRKGLGFTRLPYMEIGSIKPDRP